MQIINIHTKPLLIFFLLSCSHISLSGQIIIPFENLLNTPESIYDGSDQAGGFADQGIFFSTFYDTAFGGFWAHGWALSTMTDTVSSGFLNQFSAKAGSGYDGSTTYTVAYQNDFYNAKPVIDLTADGIGGKSPLGFYVTNSTYAYNSMRDGDAIAKKFGGPTGEDPDFFKMTIRAYQFGQLTPDSVTFYLADYRFEDNNQDYIVKDWSWVDLSPLNWADSLVISLNSSDVGMFGMNTPAYFCLDHFTFDTTISSTLSQKEKSLRIYPNPATDRVWVDGDFPAETSYQLWSALGRMVQAGRLSGHAADISLEGLPAGLYVLSLANGKVGIVQKR
jgi:hypothetical protein